MTIAVIAFAVFSVALLAFHKVRAMTPSLVTCISVSVCGFGLSMFTGLIRDIHISDVVVIAASLLTILTVSITLMQMNLEIKLRTAL
jgi:hypothetical protein